MYWCRYRGPGSEEVVGPRLTGLRPCGPRHPPRHLPLGEPALARGAVQEPEQSVSSRVPQFLNWYFRKPAHYIFTLKYNRLYCISSVKVSKVSKLSSLASFLALDVSHAGDEGDLGLVEQQGRGCHLTVPDVGQRLFALLRSAQENHHPHWHGIIYLVNGGTFVGCVYLEQVQERCKALSFPEFWEGEFQQNTQ